MQIFSTVMLMGLVSVFSTNASQLFDNVSQHADHANVSALDEIQNSSGTLPLPVSTGDNISQQIRSEWTISEDMTLLLKHNMYGKNWTLIQYFFPNKSLSAIKNRLRIVKKKYDKKPTINALPRPDFSGLNLTYSESDQNGRLFAPLLPANFVPVECIKPLPFEF